MNAEVAGNVGMFMPTF